MNTAEFDKLFIRTTGQLAELSGTKGQEYSQQQEDRLSNFKRLSASLGLSPEKVLWVYMSKHMDSIVNWVKELDKDVEERMELSEPIEGRIDDAMLYLLLLKGLLRDRYLEESIHKVPPVHRDPDVPPGCP